MLIIVFQILLNCFLQAGDAGERPTPNPFLGDLRKPALDLIDPRAAGRSEVQLVSRMTGEPSNHLRRLMRAVVVQHQMDLAGVGWQRRVYHLHELEELLMAVTTVTSADHLPRTMRSCHAARNRWFVVPADRAATAELAASDPALALAIFHPRTARWHVPAGSDTDLRCPAPSPPARDRLTV